MDKNFPNRNELITRAIHFAQERHAGQVRKGTTRPYITHPIETMKILSDMNADTNLLIAGILHDTLEDTDTTDTEIMENFGADVCSLVTAHSEDKTKSWDERKTHSIQATRNGSTRLKMLVLADKVANMRDMKYDYTQVGDKLWDRFNAPKEKQAWYYCRCQEALNEMQDYPETAPVYHEMETAYRMLFDQT